MPAKNKIGQFAIVSLLTTLLTASFIFISPLGARYMHMTFGRLAYWFFAIVSVAALVKLLPQWALAQMIVFLLIGLYSELEQQKVSRFYSAMSSVAVSVIAVFFSLGVWAQLQNISLSTFLKKQVSSTMLLSPQMKALSSNLEISQVVSVLPAFIAFLLMVLLFFGSLFIRPLGKNDKMTAFQIPEYVIWIFTLSLAGSFLLDPIKYFIAQKIALNVLFIALCAYYFQGVAVLGFIMNRVKINYFLKVVIFFVLAFQLFAAVVALGLSDVWFGYRSRVFKNLIKNNPYAGD